MLRPFPSFLEDLDSYLAHSCFDFKSYNVLAFQFSTTFLPMIMSSTHLSHSQGHALDLVLTVTSAAMMFQTSPFPPLHLSSSSSPTNTQLQFFNLTKSYNPLIPPTHCPSLTHAPTSILNHVRIQGSSLPPLL